MLLKFGLFFVGILLTTASNASSYTCEIKYLDPKDFHAIKTEQTTIDFGNFLDDCQKGKCFMQKTVSGGEKTDSSWVAIYGHNSKPPVVAVMLMYFERNLSGTFEQKSLAGTNFGNNLYTQVQAPNTGIWVICSYTN